MSILSINRIASKISTRIRQASLDPLGVEALMYTGEQVASMYAYDIKPSTWSQISWCDLGCSIADSTHTFGIAGRELGLTSSFDYLLAIALEAIFPQVTLANTPCPVPYTVTLPTSVGSTTTNTVPLYYYVSDGSMGIAANTIVVGTLTTLTSTTSGLSLSPLSVQPFVSYSPRHMISWSQYALLAAIEHLCLRVNGVEYENFDRNALFNALQFRTRQDVFPVAVEEATSFRATQVQATVGNGAPAILGGVSEDSRYKAFTVPFGFTTSALADRGQNGKHLSAFPLLLCCDSAICLDIKAVNDLRDLLVLQEECMVDYSCYPVIMAVPSSLFTTTTGSLSGNIILSNGSVNMSIIAQGNLTTSLNTSNSIIGTSSSVTITSAPVSTTLNPVTGSIISTSMSNMGYNNSVGCGCPTMNCGSNGNCNSMSINGISLGSCMTFGNPCGCNVNTNNTSTTRTFSPFNLGSLGIKYLQQTGEYIPVTRFNNLNPQCPLGREIDYSHWIVSDGNMKLRLHAKALGALVTDYERGMTKTDCRNRKFLYESYSYSCDKTVLPGSEHCIKLCAAPGQFKYSYTFAENETSKLQGQYFNFTNSTDFNIVADPEIMGTKFIFEGHDSVLFFKQKIEGYDDFHARSKFITYVDNPLFAQRAPRITGLHIVPRYANWINSIYPDGSINLESIACAELEVKTTPSADHLSCHCPYFRKPNTIRYHLTSISVFWRIAFFELADI